MLQACIDHRTIKARNLRADGLAESAVGMFKLALTKMAQGPNARAAWEDFVPYIRLAYNCTPWRGSKVAPTVTMMAQLPTLPCGVREALEEPLYYVTDTEMNAAATNLLKRATLVQ